MNGSTQKHVLVSRLGACVCVAAVWLAGINCIYSGAFAPLGEPTAAATRSPAPPRATRIATQPARLAPTASQAGTAVTNAAGEAQFNDPLSSKNLVVTVKSKASHKPLAGIRVGFVSNGPEVLVVGWDPQNTYLPGAKVFAYAALAAEGSGGTGILATPDALSAALLLVNLAEVGQNPQDWRAAFTDLPRIEHWTVELSEACIASKDILAVGGGPVVLVHPGEALLEPFLGRGYFAALGSTAEELRKAARQDALARRFQSQPPAVVRWKIFSLQKSLPLFAEPLGFCLEPLNRKDGQSVLDWVIYGLDKKDVFPFEQLTGGDGLSYVNYIEGGQKMSLASFLDDLRRRLASSSPYCDLYASSAQDFQVWTKGWSPAWQIDTLCYGGCVALDPPWVSSTPAFLFKRDSGEWQLQTVWLNSPEFWKDSYKIPFSSCYARYIDPLSIPTPTMTPSACLGAPMQRLKIGQRGMVCTKSDPVMLHAGPDRSTDKMRFLLPGTEFTVLDGPSCAEQWSFWKVRTDSGYTGWLTEGSDAVDRYFLCPTP